MFCLWQLHAESFIESRIVLYSGDLYLKFFGTVFLQRNFQEFTALDLYVSRIYLFILIVNSHMQVESFVVRLQQESEFFFFFQVPVDHGSGEPLIVRQGRIGRIINIK